MEHPEASTALRVVAVVISHGPEYRVSEVPEGTPVFPAPGHAPDEVLGGGVGAVDDELELVVEDEDEVADGVVDDELDDAVEGDELEDEVDEEEVVLVRVCHRVGLGFRHQPPP
jgi:hypothetical protein